MLDSGFMPIFNLREVTEISKVVDVMLLLGRKQVSCSWNKWIVYLTHFA